MNLSPRIFLRNVLANWTGLLAEVLVAFALTPFIIKSLGLTTYGLWGFLNSLIGYMGLVDLGIRGGVGRFINYHLGRKEAQEAREVIGTSLAFLSAMVLVALAIALILAIGFPWFFPRTPADLMEQARVVLPFMALGLWFSFTSAIFSNVCAAFDRFDLINGVALSLLAVRASGTVVVLSLGWGFTGLVTVTLSSYALATLGYYCVARRLWPEMQLSRHCVQRSRFKELWRFSVVSFASRSAATLAAQAGPLLAMLLSGPKAVGVYSIAQMLIQSSQRVVEQLGTTLYPTIMKMGGGPDYDGLRAMFRRLGRMQCILAGLLYFGIIAYAAPFIGLWVGPGLEEAAQVAALLAVGELMCVYNSSGTLTLFALGRLRIVLTIALVHGFAIVLFSALGMWSMQGSLVGLAAGMLVAAVLAHGIAYPLAALREIGQPAGTHYLVTTLRVMFLAIGAWIVFTLAQQWIGVSHWPQLIASIALGTVGYLILSIPILGRDLRPVLARVKSIFG